MTDEEINVLWSKLSADNGYQGKIIPFARLVAARQREKDAEICDKRAAELCAYEDKSLRAMISTAESLAAAIRAQGD